MRYDYPLPRLRRRSTVDLPLRGEVTAAMT